MSKITLIATACLLIGGTVGCLILIKNYPGKNGLEYNGGYSRLKDAIFMRVTSRTAGFNAVDIA